MSKETWVGDNLVNAQEHIEEALYRLGDPQTFDELSVLLELNDASFRIDVVRRRLRRRLAGAPAPDPDPDRGDRRQADAGRHDDDQVAGSQRRHPAGKNRTPSPGSG